MSNPFIRQDTYFKNGDSFKRKITGKEFGSGLGNFFKRSWSKANFIYIFLAVLLIYFFSAINTFNWNLFTNIWLSSVTIGVIAIGMGLIILLGDIDLSVGSMFAFAGGIGILAHNAVYSSTGDNGLAFLVCLIACLGVGVVCGFINGFFIGLLKMPSFIVTLATMLIFRSIIQYILSIQVDPVTGQNISTFRLTGYTSTTGNWLYNLYFTQVLQISMVTIIFIIIGILVWLMTKYTKFGRKIYAVGSNAKAAGLVGIKSSWIKVAVFSIAGGLVGISSLLQIAMRGNIDAAATGTSYELYAIASVVLGGIAMSGGRGSILGVIFGTAAFQTIDRIIAALHLNPNLNDTIKGAILIIAIALQVVKFSKEDFIRYLQKLNLIYVPNKDLLLESEYKTKVENLEKLYTGKINKINHSTKLSEEEIVSSINSLLDEKEAKLKALKDKYDVLIEKARITAIVHDEKERINATIAKKKHEILNQKQYDIYVLKNKKQETAPWKGEYTKLEKKIVLEQAKFINQTNNEILHAKARIGMDPKQIEHLREFTLGYANDAEKEKINTEHDQLLNKYNAYQEKINSQIEKENTSFETKLSSLEQKYTVKLENALEDDKTNHDKYESLQQALQEKENAKQALKEQKENDKAARKAEKEALLAEKDAKHQELEKELSARLEKIIKNRK